MSRTAYQAEEPETPAGCQQNDAAQQQQQQQAQSLERSLSAPMRLKQADLGPISRVHLDSEQPAIKSSRKAQIFRHSHRDRAFNHCGSSTASASGATSPAKLERHKSILPPICLNSSSASDSALSQSRSTLGSESGHSTTSCSYTKTCPADDEKATADDRLSSGSGHIPYSNPDAHFKIVWQRLTYRVPEKRLTRLVACLSKLKKKWLPVELGEEEEEEDEDEEGQAASDLCRDTGQVFGLSKGLDAAGGDGGGGAGAGAGGAGAGDGSVVVSVQKHHMLMQSPSASSAADSAPRRIQKQRQVIFSNLNGCVKSGQLSAILGPSGAGKTTLLKCLTNDIERGVSGRINIHSNRNSAGSHTSQHLKLCVIPQKDYLFDNLTVMENLLFASRIKNTRKNFDHQENVHRISNLLGLQACLKLKTSRLSGGQSKRVSIAQELLSQPDILILDEPTSGLDSLTCYRTVSVLRELADMSKAGLLPPLAIVMTIHQPQMKIFNLFHHVYIMSSLGSCVYEGRPEFLIDTVADCCKLLPPPDDQNPASFIIELASEVYGAEPIEKLIELQRENFNLMHSSKESSTCETYDENDNVTGKKFQQMAVLDCTNLTGGAGLKTQAAELVAHQSGQGEQGDEKLLISAQLRKRSNHDHSFWLHTGLLIKRLWISMWRDSLLTTTRITFHLVIPFVFYFVYSQKSGMANACPHVERELDIQDMVSDSNIQRLTIQHDELILTFENVSLFFLLLYSFSMCVLAVTALSFPLNMQILLKETSNGWYTMPRFVMAKTLADLPIELTMPMVSVSIAYALTGQPSSYLCWRMLAVTAVMTLCSLISQTQGLLFGAYFMNNVQAAVFVSQASTLPWIMLSGFTTRVSQLPRPLQWLSFGSIYRLGIESIVAVRYGFGMCPCDEELVNDTPPRIIGIPDQVKSVMSYYMDSYSNGSPQTTTALPSVAAAAVAGHLPQANGTNREVDIFGKIASTLARANTYGADIVSCSDVKPFIMSAREVNESTLPIFLSVLVGVLIVLKILLFYVVKIRAG